LAFTTRNGTHTQRYGGPKSDDSFTFTAPQEIVGFHGRVGAAINEIGFIYK